ncbi:MAG: hypothetical protein WDN72_00535 [Alphaproteobacteria bacterium]
MMGSDASTIANRMTGNEQDPGLVDSFASWFINPNADMPDQ